MSDARSSASCRLRRPRGAAARRRPLRRVARAVRRRRPLLGAAAGRRAARGRAHNVAGRRRPRCCCAARRAPEEPARAFAAAAPSRCQHVLQRRRDARATPSAGTCELRTPFVYVEARGEQQLMLAGTCVHRLVKVGSDWRIRLKRVDLLDAGAPLPAIQLFPDSFIHPPGVQNHETSRSLRVGCCRGAGLVRALAGRRPEGGPERLAVGAQLVARHSLRQGHAGGDGLQAARSPAARCS